MSYRQPQTDIYLFKGCPCDHEYNNTIYFSSKAEQWAYFRSLPQRVYTNQNYQRSDANTLKIRTEVNTLTNNAGTEDIYEYNYLMFSNDSRFAPLGSPANDVKIFYAFITGRKYINDNTTEITYEIDVMQTYMFDYKLGICFVEREHSISDKIGENLVPELFDGKDYYNEKIYQLNPIRYESYRDGTDYYLAIKYVPNETAVTNWEVQTYSDYTESCLINFNWRNIGYDPIQHTYEGSKGEYRNGAYSGYRTIYIPIYKNANYNGQNIESFIISATRESAVICDISVVPNYLVHLVTTETVPPTLPADSMGYSLSKNITYTKTSNDLIFKDKLGHTYIPKNKKLYQYPYDYITAYNNKGDKKEYYWEDFQSIIQNSVEFEIKGVVNTPEIAMFPKRYNSNEDYNYNDKISIENFPSISWSEDSFARMWSENKNQITYGLIQSAIGSIATVAGGVMGGIAGASVGSQVGGIVGKIAGNKALGRRVGQGIKKASESILPYQLTGEQLGETAVSSTQQVASDIAGLLDAVNKRDIYNGTQSTSQISVLKDKTGITLYRTSIKPYYAKQIDSFFTMYGYKTNSLKIPNIFEYNENLLRPHWNYIKNIQTIILPSNDRYVNEEVESKLKSIFNNGITYWMNGGEVGDYSLDNSPQS